MGDHAPPGRRLSEPPDAAPPGPVEAETEALERGRRLFARPSRFVAAAAEIGAIPAESLPEVAFAGRSNVGKSSLVNALTGRRMLARTSNTPGRTRQINFFALGGELMLVDLPGYGYATASKAAIERWTRLVRHYLQARAALRRVCLLIDARHGIKEPDRPVMHLLDAAGVSYQIVLTKADKTRAGERAAAAERLAGELAAHPAAHPEIHLTSARDGLGIAGLRAALAGLTGPSLPAGSPAAPR